MRCRLLSSAGCFTGKLELWLAKVQVAVVAGVSTGVWCLGLDLVVGGGFWLPEKDSCDPEIHCDLGSLILSDLE